MPDRIGIFGHEERPRAKEALELLIRELREHFPNTALAMSEGMASLVRPKDAAVVTSLYELAASCDTLFSIGGDGTMLMAARAIERANPNACLIGVNLGKLGFLSEHPPEELHALIGELASNTLETEMRLMRRATVRRETGEQ